MLIYTHLHSDKPYSIPQEELFRKGMKTKSEILEWFNAIPKTKQGYNLLSFLPRISGFMEHLEKKPAKWYHVVVKCIKHGEYALSLPIKPHPVFMTHEGWFQTFHYWLNDKGHSELKIFLDRILEGPALGLDFEQSLTKKVLSLILKPNENTTIELCEDYSLLAVGVPKEESASTFKMKVCPKCQDWGKPFTIQKLSGSVYLYYQHYNDEMKPINKCYIGVLKSGKKPKEKCPKCGKLGRKHVDQRGYLYFYHYEAGKRVSHYIGKASEN